mgnify:CR=1 FL=1
MSDINNLKMDVYVKKKNIDTRKKKIDRRNIKIKLSQEQLIKQKIYYDIGTMGTIFDINTLVEEFIKYKNIANLNYKLLALVYTYLSEKEFDINQVVLNFDQDFEKQLQIINDHNIFPQLKEDAKKIYLFRQDFIMYLIIINNEINKQEEEESQFADEDDFPIEESLYNYI